MNESPFFEPKPLSYSHLIAGLAAFGTALQNYQAVALSLTNLAQSTVPATRWLDWSIQATALSAGGLCSGMVNFWMNIELLEDFFKRVNAKEGYQYKKLKLNTWECVQYFGGIFVFVVTGILFGLMAFTFAMTGPLAILSIGVGLLVAGIMTIQEVETWLASYDNDATASQETLSTSQLMGKYIGHIIAIGNVIALSLLFTLSLAQALIALNVAAVPALITGFAVAFTFGAFTEFFFYNTYLASFCQNFNDKINQLNTAPNAWFAWLCVTTNALVNIALSYAGIEILTALLIATHIALPPLAVVTAITAVLAIFAGAASFILGLDFWSRQNPATSAPVTSETDEAITGKETKKAPTSFAKSSLIMFSASKMALANNSDEFTADDTCSVKKTG